MLSAQTIKLRLDIPNDQCCKKTFRFRFPFRFFFLPFKITKSQSFGSISFVIYIPIYPATTAAKECLACSIAN